MATLPIFNPATTFGYFSSQQNLDIDIMFVFDIFMMRINRNNDYIMYHQDHNLDDDYNMKVTDDSRNNDIRTYKLTERKLMNPQSYLIIVEHSRTINENDIDTIASKACEHYNGIPNIVYLTRNGVIRDRAIKYELTVDGKDFKYYIQRMSEFSESELQLFHIDDESCCCRL